MKYIYLSELASYTRLYLCWNTMWFSPSEFPCSSTSTNYIDHDLHNVKYYYQITREHQSKHTIYVSCVHYSLITYPLVTRLGGHLNIPNVTKYIIVHSPLLVIIPIRVYSVYSILLYWVLGILYYIYILWQNATDMYCK